MSAKQVVTRLTSSASLSTVFCFGGSAFMRLTGGRYYPTKPVSVTGEPQGCKSFALFTPDALHFDSLLASISPITVQPIMNDIE